MAGCFSSISTIMKKWLCLVILIAIITCNPKPGSMAVRKPVLAGRWYPADAHALAKTIDQLLQKAPIVQKTNHPLIVIVPHAGYQFSGAIAAQGYRTIQNARPDIIVLLAPAHHGSFRGCSVMPVDYYETPLGLLPIDIAAVRRLLTKPLFLSNHSADAAEHAIEIQLPFLQRLYPDASRPPLLPILIGNIHPGEARSIACTLAASLTAYHRPLFIISSDFTHYGPRFGYTPFPVDKNNQEKLRKLDFGAIDAILAQQPDRFGRYIDKTGATICGHNPIMIALTLPVKQLSAALLAYDTSARGTGDYTNIVSYAAIALYGSLNKSPDPAFADDCLAPADKKFLLDLARRNIISWLTDGRPCDQKESGVPESCRLNRGAFVTIKKDGELRGCIGAIAGTKPLYQTVTENAFNAAFKDPRFTALSKSELASISIEISVLTEPRPVTDTNAISIGRDGLIIEQGPRRGLLLPQVAVEWGWNREEFLVNVCRKAGLADRAWKQSGVRLYSFQAIVFDENRMKSGK